MVNMKGLLLIAHGSRLASSNSEIALLAERLNQRLGQLSASQYDVAKHCFLELCQPDIPETIGNMVSDGCKQVTLFPYFLAAGHHVTTDLPEFLAKARSAYPDVDFHLLPHIGAVDAIVDLILDASVTPR